MNSLYTLFSVCLRDRLTSSCSTELKKTLGMRWYRLQLYFVTYANIISTDNFYNFFKLYLLSYRTFCYQSYIHQFSLKSTCCFEGEQFTCNIRYIWNWLICVKHQTNTLSPIKAVAKPLNCSFNWFFRISLLR